ncbi:MAG: hypothetical protein ACKO0Z_13385 [Betaproteobacteria bacterium]
MFKQISGAILCTAATATSATTLIGIELGTISPGFGVVLAVIVVAAMVVGFQWMGE